MEIYPSKNIALKGELTFNFMYNIQSLDDRRLHRFQSLHCKSSGFSIDIQLNVLNVPFCLGKTALLCLLPEYNYNSLLFIRNSILNLTGVSNDTIIILFLKYLYISKDHIHCASLYWHEYIFHVIYVKPAYCSVPYHVPCELSHYSVIINMCLVIFNIIVV